MSQVTLFTLTYAIVEGRVFPGLAAELLVLNSVITTFVLYAMVKESCRLLSLACRGLTLPLLNALTCGLLYTPLALYYSASLAESLESIARECCSARLTVDRSNIILYTAPFWFMLQPILGYVAGELMASLKAADTLSRLRMGWQLET